MAELITPLLNVAERALDVASARQRVIAQNMANVDTPGYHARDVDFAHELKKLLSGEIPENTQPVSQVVPGLIARPDGNTVNVDRESLLLAQTQLKFETSIQVARAEFKRVQMAIQEQ
jgi:flagellar basal-body rod protein FlgB